MKRGEHFSFMEADWSWGGDRACVLCYDSRMYIKVRVHPEARKEEVVKKDDTHYEIWVKEPALRNLANTRIVELVAREFKLVIGKVRIISGHHSPSKILSIDTESVPVRARQK